MVPRLLKITHLASFIALLDSTALESVLTATTPCCHHLPPAPTSRAWPLPNTHSFSSARRRDEEEPGSNSHSSPFCLLSLTTPTLPLPTPPLSALPPALPPSSRNIECQSGKIPPISPSASPTCCMWRN